MNRYTLLFMSAVAFVTPYTIQPRLAWALFIAWAIGMVYFDLERRHREARE